MATIKFTNSKSSIKKIHSYITQKKKTKDELISTKDCLKVSAIDEMILTKNQFNKNNGRQYIHIVQSFDPKDNLSYEKANEIGVELAEYFKGFQAVICTHTDRNHIHNHILLNSVNFETGYKFQQSKKDMEKVKDYSDKLCLQNGLSIIENPNKNTYLKQNEYQVALKGESWKIQLMVDIDSTIKTSKSKKDFINQMEEKSYKVDWSDSKKYITFTTPQGKKCRDNKLRDKKYSKEVLAREFRSIEATTHNNESTRGFQENGINEISKSNSTPIQPNNDGGMELTYQYTRDNRRRNKETLHRQNETSGKYSRRHKIQQANYRERNYRLGITSEDEVGEARYHDNEHIRTNPELTNKTFSKSKGFDFDR